MTRRSDGAPLPGAMPDEAPDARSGTGRLRSAPIWISFGLSWWYLALRLPAPTPMGVDLDSSWRWALNVLGPASRWGDELAFTYGPIGWLLQPLPVAAHLSLSLLAFALATLTLATWVTERVFRFRASVVDSVLPLIVLLLGGSLGLERDGFVLLAFVLLVAGLRFEDAPLRGRLRAFLVAALGGALLLVKFNLGLGALAVLALQAALGGDGAGRSKPFAMALGWATGVAGTAFCCFDSAAALVRFGSRSWEIARGFSAAMSTPARAPDLALLLLVSVAVLVVLLREARAPRDVSLFLLALLLPVAFLEFKHGFVRAWHRAPAFFAFLAIATAFAPLAAARVTTRRRLRVLAAACLAGSLASARIHGRELEPGRWWPSPTCSWHELARVASPAGRAEERDALARAWRTAASELELPERWLEDLRTGGIRTGVLPWRLAYCAANDLRCAAPPTIQLYSAYTPALDEWTARWVETNGPERFLVHYPETQQRYFFSSAPATWRAVRARYRVIDALPERALLLLGRQAGPAPGLAERPVTLRIGEWTRLPESPAGLITSGILRPTLLGRLSEAAFQLPLPELELAFADGAILRKRIVAAQVEQGIDLSALPRGFEQVEQLLRGAGIPHPLRARLLASTRLWRIDASDAANLDERRGTTGP